MSKHLVVLTRDRTTDTYDADHRFEIDEDGDYLHVFGADNNLVATYTRHHWTAARYVESA